MSSPDKRRFPRAIALTAAADITAALTGATESDRLVIAGSLRRGRQEVGDVEIVYVPKIGIKESGLFRDKVPVNFATSAIDRLVAEGVLAKRQNMVGGFTWGEKNKLAVHVATGVPVDLFGTSLLAWWNYLVCRTGPAELNQRIASLAIGKGWHWAPYDHGFKRYSESLAYTEWHTVTSEQDVFAFVGLSYQEPHER